MNLKNAALLALIGALMVTIVAAADFINTAFGVARDLIPALALLRSLVYLFAGISVTAFFWSFHKAQS